ncbi:glycosyltransferase [Streptomyces sp. NPDC059786]|uniref:glycosyltransferase n=1 Tax=Streptomyces sp. NPDC059786 TaxID=3346946 RepID=UPI003652C9B5
MDIVFLLPDLPLSGAATRTVHLAEHLVTHGHRVECLTFLRTVDASLVLRLRRAGVRVARLTEYSGAKIAMALLFGKRKAILHAAMPTAGVLALSLSSLSRNPVLYSYTNCLHVHRPLVKRSPLDRLKGSLEAFMADRCDVLHAVSDNVSKQILREYPHAAERVRSIRHENTPPASGGPSTRALDELSNRSPRLLCVGRLEPHKRIDDAIRAVAHLRQSHPGVLLTVLGAGPEQTRLASLADELDVAKHVHFAGTSGSPDLFFEWADVLLHPSVFEGYPRVLVEAQAKRVPIVTIDSPYSRYFAASHDAVHVARPLDAQALAERTAEALTRAQSFNRADDLADICAFCDMYADAPRRRRRGVRSLRGALRERRRHSPADPTGSRAFLSGISRQHPQVSVEIPGHCD